MFLSRHISDIDDSASRRVCFIKIYSQILMTVLVDVYVLSRPVLRYDDNARRRVCFI